jgi:epsilon-lactone hydrolase
MQNFLRGSLRGALRLLFKGVMVTVASERLQRVWMEIVTATTLGARGARRERGTWGVAGEWVRHRDSATSNRAVLYLHGGGYTLGSPNTHKALTTHLAKAARCHVLVPAYRLAPEHPYPAPLDDALAAYRALLERYSPEQIAIGGDSAGGGLALSTTLALREAGLPMPAALLLISPWTDLSLSGSTIDSLDAIDPMLGRAWLTRAADAYRRDLPLTDPKVSPLFAKLDGLPPTLIQVGSDEILLDDSHRFTERARAAGVEVTLEIEPGYWHDFQVHAGVLDASDAAIARIAAFFEARWGTA